MDKFNTKRKMGSSKMKNSNVFHFSHPHPLEYATSTSTGDATCFGCKLSIAYGEYYYNCKTCAFYLHYVCYKMPLITNHLAHLAHDLVLIATPSSPATKTTLNCMACGHHVTGFSYHCAECSAFFHTFCLALPLSISLTHHPHKIQLEFSPPYDFFCDFCNKPGHKGWLYRCNMCEFDSHIACAVANVESQSFQHPSFPESNKLLKQLTNMQVDHTIGYDIMRLVAQQIGEGNNNSIKELDDCAIAGWDKRLYSPRKKNNANNGANRKKKKNIVELQYIEERSPIRDKLTPLSDKSIPLSNQFSDSYFSIDLGKSYDRRNKVGKEVSSDQLTRFVVPERINGSNSRQVEEPFEFDLVNWPSNNIDSYNEAKQNKLKTAAFFERGRNINDFEDLRKKVVGKNSDQSLVKWSIQDHTINKSASERYSHSGWRRFLACCL